MISAPSSSIPEPLAATRTPRALRVWAAAALWLVASQTPVLADLKLCNGTSSRIGVAIGYKDASGWATEGWWNIAAQSCETLLHGAPPGRYMYVHGVDYDRGGEWAGGSLMCTGDKSFRIREITECEKRGHRSTGFMEVDTGGDKDWTIRFNDPE